MECNRFEKIVCKKLSEFIVRNQRMNVRQLLTSQLNKTTMQNEKRLGIWMDHANAHLMEYADPIVRRVVTSNSNKSTK